MTQWTARVSVTRKMRGTGEFRTCEEISIKRATYDELMRRIEFIMNTFSQDLFCCTCVIQKHNVLS